MEPANIRQDTSVIWEKLIKPTYRAHLFDEVSTPLRYPNSQNDYTHLCFTVSVEEHSRDEPQDLLHQDVILAGNMG